MMRRPGGRPCAGFTAVELAICLSITAIFVPIIYHGAAMHQDEIALGLWHMQTADQVEAVAEQVRLDARLGAWNPTLPGFDGGSCAVTYKVDDQRVLIRDSRSGSGAGCSGTRALASGVASISGDPAGLEVVFTRALRPDVKHSTTVFIPVVSE